MRTRREAIVTIAGAATAQAQQHQHPPEVVQIAGVYQPAVLTAAEMKWVGRLADTIIPRTETPGASDAGVPEFIDRRLRGNDRLAAAIRQGIASLDAAARSKYQVAFDALDNVRAVELLTPISRDEASELGRFFRVMKDLTIDGYYSSKPGLTEELGWHGNTYLASFEGCTHKEHQS